MNVMKAKTETPNLTRIAYPCYVNPIPKGERVLYIPGINHIEQFPELERVSEYVIEGYLTDKFLAFDCMTVDEFMARKCEATYEERLRKLRQILNDQIADYTKVIDLPTDKVETPKEIKDLYKEYLTDGCEGIILRSVDATYHFGVCENAEVMELKPNDGN